MELLMKSFKCYSYSHPHYIFLFPSKILATKYTLEHQIAPSEVRKLQDRMVCLLNPTRKHNRILPWSPTWLVSFILKYTLFLCLNLIANIIFLFILLLVYVVFSPFSNLFCIYWVALTSVSLFQMHTSTTYLVILSTHSS